MSDNETFVCAECGRTIPEGNRTIHSARCSGKHDKAPEQPAAKALAAEEEIDLDALAMAAAAGTLPTIPVATPVSSPPEASAPELHEHWECPSCTMHNFISTNACQACGFVTEMRQAESREGAPAAAMEPAAAGAGWVCEMCTFYNNHSDAACEMCANERIRPPDATVRERLVDPYPSFVPDDLLPPPDSSRRHEHRGEPPPDRQRRLSEEFTEDSSDSNPFASMTAGAMIGGIFGGVAAMMGGDRNRSVMQGAMQGAAMGVFGTSLLSDMGATFTTSTTTTGPGGTTTRTTRSGPGGRRTTTRRTRPAPRRANPLHPDAQTLQFEDMMRLVFQGMQSQQGATGVNVDGMSYEQLLARFGFGTDSRAADERVITSLTSEQLKEDSVDAEGQANACSICLEPLLRGEECTKLACSHSYHTGCINEWLRNVGNCPVCKHAV